MTTMINCTCESKFQDTTYGIGKRVANFTGKNDSSGQARCTVCGKVYQVQKAKTITFKKEK